MNPEQSPDARAAELIKAMSLDEKIQMVHQQGASARPVTSLPSPTCAFRLSS
jgi:hypothetical protein